MEKMLTKDNFIEAERLLGKNKRDNRKAQYIAENAERYGVRLLEKMKSAVYSGKRGTVWRQAIGKDSGGGVCVA